MARARVIDPARVKPYVCDESYSSKLLMDDFVAQTSLSWDNFGTSRDMSHIQMSVLDTSDELIGRCGYYDSWVASRGSIGAGAGAGHYTSGASDVGFSGSRSFEIVRESDIGACTYGHSPINPTRYCSYRGAPPSPRDIWSCVSTSIRTPGISPHSAR